MIFLTQTLLFKCYNVNSFIFIDIKSKMLKNFVFFFNILPSNLPNANPRIKEMKIISLIFQKKILQFFFLMQL